MNAYLLHAIVLIEISSLMKMTNFFNVFSLIIEFYSYINNREK